MFRVPGAMLSEFLVPFAVRCAVTPGTRINLIFIAITSTSLQK
jgi:hypothetical protein